MYTGTNVNALTLVGRDDGTGAGTNKVTFDAVAGTTYHVAVSANQFVLNFDVSAINDKFSTSVAIGGANGRLAGWNHGADRQPGEPTHAGNSSGGSLWYSWTAPATGFASFDTSGSDFDTVLGVYTGASVEDLVGIASNDDAAGGGTRSRVTFPTVAGVVYRIAVEGKSNARGDFVLRWRAPEIHDMQAAPIVIAAGGGSSTSNLLGAGTEFGEPAPCGASCDATVWYEWTPSFSGIAGIRTSAASFDTVLAAYTGAPGSLVQVASNDDYAGATTSRLRFAVTSGTTYRIQVASKAAAGAGTFTLQANVAPGNDNFASSTLLSGTTAIWNGHNFGASSEAGEPVHAGVAGGRSVWLRWVATSTGTMMVDTQGSEIDTLLGVYTGASVNALATIASDDDTIAPQSRLTFAATVGTTYYIAIDGKAGEMGDISVRLNIPLNDMVASATPIVDSGFAPVAASTIGATREIGEPDFNSTAGVVTVWFQWTITTESSRTLKTSNGSVFLEVFTTSAFATLRPVDTMGMYGSGTYRGRLPVGTYWVRASSTGHNFTLTSPPPVANDDVANAQVIAGAGPWAGNDSEAAGEAFEMDLGYRTLWADWRIPSTWFTWTAPATGVTTFSVSGSRVLSIWKDEPDRANMPRVDLTGSTDALRTFTAQAGTTYLLRVAVNTSGGAFTLTLNPAPGNDAFASALVLGDPIANRATRDISGGTCEGGEPNHAGVGCDASIWYRWTPSTTGSARITTVGSRTNTTVAMYTGATLGTLVQVGASAGPHPAFTKGAQIDVAVTAATTYYIAVSSRDGGRGITSIQVGMTPLGDDIAAPIVIAGNSGSVSGTTVGATVEDSTTDNPQGVSYSGTAPDPFEISSVWMRWNPTYTGLARIESVIGFDGKLEVYDGPSNNLNRLSLQNSAGLGDIPLVTPTLRLVPVVSGETYWFRVADNCCFGNYWGTYSLSINLVPNDNFASARTFGPTASRSTEYALAGTTEVGEPDHGGAGDPRTYWWNWTAPANATVRFTTARSDLDTALGVYTGAAVNTLALVAQDDDSIDDDARVQFAAVSGTTYRIAVSVAGASYGAISLRRDAPNNDEPDDSILLTGASASASATIANAAFDLAERTHLSRPLSGTSIWSYNFATHGIVWYRWVAPATAPVSLKVGSTDWTISAFQGATPATMVPTAGLLSTIATGKELRFDAVGGTTYYFGVGQVLSGWGNYSTTSLGNGIDAGEGVAALTLDQLPANDDLANSEWLAGWSASDTVNTTLATRENGEPDHSEVGGRSVWYSWTAPANGAASITTVGSDFDTLLGVYTGNTIATLADVELRDDYPISTRATVTFDAVAGTTYRIAIDGYRGASGNAVLGLNVRPPNDDFANAYTVTEDVARASGYSINSTFEGSEPDHAGAGTDSSVWWNWTPATNQAAVIDTFGSDFDTVLAVYTGGALGSLVAVASNDDTGGNQSRVAFAAVAGTTYRIAIGGVGDTGNVRLRVNPRAPLTPDLISPIGGATSASRTGPFRVRVQHSDVAVLSGSQIEVCDDVVAPADPWASNCVAGYQLAASAVLYSDDGLADASIAIPLTRGASFHWRARTIDDAGEVSAWSAPTNFVVGASVSVAVSTLGYADAARDAGPLSFGTVLPGLSTTIGPAGSGQQTPGAAFVVTTTSDDGTAVSSSATEPTNGGTNLAVSTLAWRDHDGTGEVMQQVAWAPFTLASTKVEEVASPGVTTYEHDLRLTPAANAPPGAYTATVSYTAVAAP